MSSKLTELTTRYPLAVVLLAAAATLVLLVLAAVPSVWPALLPSLHGLEVDTDPENMLDEREPVRVAHNRLKAAFALYDMVVVGVVNDEHPEGVFNAASLTRIYDLAEYAGGLRGAAIGLEEPNAGVIDVELLAPSTVDNIEQAGPGTVRFEWLMPSPPTTDEEARRVRARAERLPLLDGTLVSEDGRAIALYLPLSSKDLSHRIYTHLRRYLAELDGDERYFITGLPVAEDTFGVEMFIQMAISAPLAMVVILVLLMIFFRQPALIISPLLVAMATVICTMGLLVATGNTIHIMSSMIPIFLMPIAVLDSVHILSELFDRYQAIGDRRRALHSVMRVLFRPMLYTSLTSAAGFASLALTPIPPVRVFGIFVAFGILLAWFLTITCIPAYVMLMSEASLAGFGSNAHGHGPAASRFGRALIRIGQVTHRRAGLVILATLVAVGVAAWGITRIEINDNPIRWFRSSHPIREADRVLNRHFAGTYMAYLALAPAGEEVSGGSSDGRDADRSQPPPATTPELPPGLAASPALDAPALPVGLGGLEPPESGAAPSAATSPAPAARAEIFKQPAVLRYLEDLQRHLLTTGVVGKSSSLADIVKTVHRELIDGSDEQFRIPDSAAAVAQSLLQYQSSHRPGDLWHFVTPDYRAASLWLQMTSGDNRDMERVVEAVAAYTREHPPPAGLTTQWFGLTYINVIWQQKMVSGMLKAFLGSFVVVLVLMTLLFRSPLWGLLSMLPLTVTIGLIYGVIGLIGKDYDMPVAVLSSLTLGLAIDFAIHFLVRARALYNEHRSWRDTLSPVFGEPARAIARNVIVIALGFTPLLAAPLVPYNTVGIFLAAILVLSGLATLVILPAVLRLLEPAFFRTRQAAP